eukprot:CAMPEP_0204596308 /NCGR_PEP_ID=MMETSP0661-20131031/53165_1 /ASSEMBLY_ACC=CAM_ASM_000606 /TAXON_ID=109239 /ORGANISM="Alexandrium margalefi, Strain AMGDE01CS-322" /LENGTH=144 /DNA_ID=CAMNT_0051606905 /DNA_START=101 /DNA_END=532 /DNA_ORIENTATION=+
MTLSSGGFLSKVTRRQDRWRDMRYAVLDPGDPDELPLRVVVSEPLHFVFLLLLDVEFPLAEPVLLMPSLRLKSSSTCRSMASTMASLVFLRLEPDLRLRGPPLPSSRGRPASAIFFSSATLCSSSEECAGGSWPILQVGLSSLE